MKLQQFTHSVKPGDPNAYTSTLRILSTLYQEKGQIIIEHIYNNIDSEQVGILKSVNNVIASTTTKLAFTLIIADAAERAVYLYPECNCSRHDNCTFERLRAIAARLRVHGSSAIPALQAYCDEGESGGAPSNLTREA